MENEDVRGRKKKWRCRRWQWCQRRRWRKFRIVRGSSSSGDSAADATVAAEALPAKVAVAAVAAVSSTSEADSFPIWCLPSSIRGGFDFPDPCLVITYQRGDDDNDVTK